MLSINDENPLTEVSKPDAVTWFNSLFASAMDTVIIVNDNITIIIITISGILTIILFSFLTLKFDAMFNFFIIYFQMFYNLWRKL